jgi:phosphatidate cytidylyltransferase
MSSSSISDTSKLYQRNVERDINTNSPRLSKIEKATVAAAAAAGAPTTEDDEMEPLPSQPNGARIFAEQSSAQKYAYYIDQLLSRFNPRWRNWIIRGVFSLIMILSFAKIVSMGPLFVSLIVLLIQIKCFQEIINIGYVVYKSHNLPWFRTLSWYFLFTSNYWLYGESLIHHFGFLMNKNNFLQPLVTYHRMIAFLLYTSGFVGFVLSLKKTYYLKQFTLFGYTHITLMILVTSSHQMIQNICEGIFKFN